MFKKIALKVMKRQGYGPYAAPVLYKNFLEDVVKTGVSFNRKLWSWRRGFFVYEANEYGLNKSNVSNYMPTTSYYKLNPVIKKFRKWVDDKLTVKLIINGIDNELMPEYYYMVRKGGFVKLSELPDGFKENAHGFFDLLEKKACLAVKSVSGSKGDGFYKFSADSSGYYINDHLSDKNQLLEILNQPSESVITEYITAHDDLKKVYSRSPNAIRVMVVNNNGNDPVIVGAFIRFGTEETGVIDNASAGGVFAGIDLDSGELFSPQMYAGKELVDCPAHPDTNEDLLIEVPHWDMVKETCCKVSSGMPGLKLMGVDVVVTDKAPKILEINSHPMILRMQQYYPLLKNKAFSELASSSV